MPRPEDPFYVVLFPAEGPPRVVPNTALGFAPPSGLTAEEVTPTSPGGRVMVVDGSGVPRDVDVLPLWHFADRAGGSYAMVIVPGAEAWRRHRVRWLNSEGSVLAALAEGWRYGRTSPEAALDLRQLQEATGFPETTLRAHLLTHEHAGRVVPVPVVHGIERWLYVPEASAAQVTIVEIIRRALNVEHALDHAQSRALRKGLLAYAGAMGASYDPHRRVSGMSIDDIAVRACVAVLAGASRDPAPATPRMPSYLREGLALLKGEFALAARRPPVAEGP